MDFVLGNLEAERKRLGYRTRAAFARAIGTRPAIYEAWVFGGKPIPSKKIYRLCMLTRCSAEHLLERKVGFVQREFIYA